MEDIYHQKQDRQSYIIHEIAFNDQERRDWIFEKARKVCSKWIEMHSAPECSPSPYWAMWLEKMDSLSFVELKDFALSNTDQGIAMRQSSPFSTVLTEEQKKKVRERIRDEFKPT